MRIEFKKNLTIKNYFIKKYNNHHQLRDYSTAVITYQVLQNIHAL